MELTNEQLAEIQEGFKRACDSICESLMLMVAAIEESKNGIDTFGRIMYEIAEKNSPDTS